VTEHHRFQLGMLMEQLGHLEDLIEPLHDRIGAHTAPQRAVLERLATIPGINRPAAEVIAAEVGTDLG